MNDLESLVRDALSDERRRVAPPHDAANWVGAAVRRQRRRHAAVGVAVASVFAVVGAALVVPLLNDEPATYVAGQPPADTGLLPWKPVGGLAEESEVVESAVDAWEDLADDEPTGDTYLVAGERWDDTEMVLLQSHTESGAASLALLTIDDGAAGPWELIDMAALPEVSAVEALALPAGTVPRSFPRILGPGSPPSLVLAPQWRDTPGRRTPPLEGWQLLPAGAGFGSEPTWRTLEDVDTHNWWVPLKVSAPSQSPTEVVLGRGAQVNGGLAPVLDIDASAGLLALTPSDVSFRLLPGETISQPSELDLVQEAAARLDISGPMTVTSLASGAGSWTVHNGEPASHRQVFAQIESNGIYTLVAYGTTDGRVTCLSHMQLDADVASLPLVGMACPQPVHGPGGPYQAHELWARTFLPDGARQPQSVVVTIEQQGGRSRIERLSGYQGRFQLGVLRNRPQAPVIEYRFQAESADGSPLLEPWVWPGPEVN